MLEFAAEDGDARLVVQEEYAHSDGDETERIIDVAYRFMRRVAQRAEATGLWREQVRRPSEFCCNQWM